MIVSELRELPFLRFAEVLFMEMSRIRRGAILICLSAAARGAEVCDEPSADVDGLWEPSLQTYFEQLKDWEYSGKPTAEIKRVRDVSVAEFDELVRHGTPFVVEDAGRGMPLLDQPCHFYHERWSNGSMRAEYHDPKRTGPEWEIFFDKVEQETKIPMTNKLWPSAVRPARKMKKLEHHMMGEYGAIAAPYIWHVKDQEALDTKRSVQQLWRPPYFLTRSSLNNWEALETFEFWFALAGGGTMAHADAYCEMTLSVQLRGSKRWRLMMLPAIDNKTEAFDTHDGNIYSTGRWKPEYEFTVHAGEAFVFPPGYMHETYVHPMDNPEGECTVGSTFQFRQPQSSRYISHFFPRFAMSHLMNEERCPLTRQWAEWATLRQGGSVRPRVDAAAAAEQEQSSIMAAMDTDGDGNASRAEVSEYLRTSPATHWAREQPYYQSETHTTEPASQDEQAIMQEEQFQGQVGNVMAYHDYDQDGTLTAAELERSLRRYHASLTRYVTSFGKRGKLFKKAEESHFVDQTEKEDDDDSEEDDDDLTEEGGDEEDEEDDDDED